MPDFGKILGNTKKLKMKTKVDTEILIIPSKQIWLEVFGKSYIDFYNHQSYHQVWSQTPHRLGGKTFKGPK